MKISTTLESVVTQMVMACVVVACSETEPKPINKPALVTTIVTEITETSAVGGGNITGEGDAPILTRGICWNSFPHPTTNNSMTVDGLGTGQFSSLLINLTSNTTYYVRAYATNLAGTFYGNEVSFTTLKINNPNEVILVLPQNGAIMDNGCLDKSNLIEWSFSWNPVPGATAYQLYVVGSNAQFPIIDVETEAIEYSFSQFGYITPSNSKGWIWRVRAFKDGNWMEWTERTFDVENLNTDC